MNLGWVEVFHNQYTKNQRKEIDVIRIFLFILFINDVCSILMSCPGHLLFADDLKIFLPIATERDRLTHQLFVNSLYCWCSSNFLNVCSEKCSVVTFSCARSTLIYYYLFMGMQLNRVNLIRNLLFEDGLTFSVHIDSIISRISQIIYLLIRSTLDFNDPACCFKILYVALVWPLLKYASIIWSPTSIRGITRLEGLL